MALRIGTRGAARRASGSIVGKLVGTLFLAVFLAAGLWFTRLVGRGFIRSAATYAWPESRCVIEASGVEEHPGADDPATAYIFRVRYHYTAGGERLIGVRFRPGYTGSADVGDAQRLAARYPPGAATVCYVDPERPDAAMLERPNLWTGFAIFLPLIFVAVGAGGIAAVWWRREPKQAGDRSGPASISRRALAGRPALGGGCLTAFFSIFLVAGLGFFLPFFAVPAWKIVAARSWTPTPCTILYSALRTHPGDESDTFSVDVLYRYRVDGREYKSSRYDFTTGSSSAYARKAAAVERHPAGSETVCYVDPDDPTAAVIDRGFGGDLWFGLIPLVFVLVGAGGIGFSLVSARRSKATRGPRWLPAPAVSAAGGLDPGAVTTAGPSVSAAALDWRAPPADGPATLKPGWTPRVKFVGITLLALFWNGITGVLVWQLVKGYLEGQPDGCLTLFLIPFVLVGLLLLISVPYQLLALFNPRPVLTLAVAAPRLGEPTTLEWRFSGFAGRIRRLRIGLEGREEATYTRGTTTSTDKEVFARLEVIDTSDPYQIASGAIALELPADTMHSFAAAHNKILWSLKLAGEIRRWPDVDQEFPLVVRPRAIGARGGAE